MIFNNKPCIVLDNLALLQLINILSKNHISMIDTL